MIKSIALRNFQGHEHSKLEMHPGVNVIVGETDSGKTSIIRALKWLVTNRVSRLKSSQDPVRRVDGKPVKEGVEVVIETDRGIVKRVRKKGFNGYVIDGEEYQDLGGKLPGDLPKVLDLQEINLQESYKPYYLITDSPGQIARTISDTLGTGDADVAVALARKAQEGIRGSIKSLTVEIAESEAVLGKLAFVDELEPKVGHIEESVGHLEKARDRLDRLMDLLSDAHLAGQDMRVAEAAVVDPAGAVAAYEVLEDVCKERKRLVGLVTEAEVAHTSTQRWRVVHDSVEALLPTAGTTLKNLEGANERREKLAVAIKAAERSSVYLGTCERDVAMQSKAVAELKDKYTELLVKMGVCPFCGERTSREHIQEALAS